MKNTIKKWLMLLIALVSTQSFSQISVTTNSTITEQFNIGTSNTASLPTGWKMSSAGTGASSNWSSATNVTTVSQAAQSGNPTAGGRYNWGINSTERAIGFMTSGSYATPNSIMAFYQNNTGKMITDIALSFDYERYRVNSGTASVTCSTSTDGSTWVARTTGNSGAFATGSNGYTFSNPLIVNKTVTLNNLAIANGSGFYVRWVFATSSSNSQGIGLDNVSFTATTTPTITGAATASSFTTTYGTASTAQSFSVSGQNLTQNLLATAPTGFEVSSDGITYGTTATFTQTSGSASGTLRVRLSPTASVTGSYNSQNIVLSSSGAANVNITTSSSGNQVSAKSLTIGGLSFPTKTYDGTTTITPTGTPTYVGLVNGESFSVTGTVTWSLASANVGTGISINRTGNYNTPSINYTVTQPSGFTANIIKADQSITFNNFPYKTTFDLDFLPDAFSSSGLGLTLTSSDQNVATIVAGKIKIVGLGVTTITASQGGNSNYNSAISVSKDLTVESPVSRWSFDNLTFSGTGQTPTVTNSQADLGDQTENTTLSGFHQSNSTVWSTFTGNGSAKSIASNNWQVGDYFTFTLNTRYTTLIRLTFDHTSSPTGPKNFKLQWSVDGVNFNDVSSYFVPYNTTANTEYSWSQTNYQSLSTVSFDLTSITQINDAPSVRFRMVNTSTSALLGGSIQSAGTSRVDNFTMFGNLDIPLPLDIISFSGKTFGEQNRLTWSLAESGVVKIQKYINKTWVEVGKTNNSVWFDEKPYKGISYYRIVTNNSISNPIYVVNEMGFEVSNLDFKYYDFNGVETSKSMNKILIKKSEFDTQKIMIIE